MKALYWFGLFLCFASANVHAQENQDANTPSSLLPNPVASASEYYTFDEKLDDSVAAARVQFASPVDLISAATATAKSALSLLSWMLHPEQMPQPTTPYQRVLQFGRWINDPTDDTCMNTRAKVLVRDSESAVTYKNNRDCVVETGYWADPYAGKQMKSAREIQIDHVVPLKHAYMAGAWKWDYQTRCLYANFMGAKYHLKSVSGHENMSKGDNAPDEYMPPEAGFRCEYLQAWLKIKAIWRLAITRSEAVAIQSLVQAGNCNPADFQMSNEELTVMRTYIKQNINYCTINHR